MKPLPETVVLDNVPGNQGGRVVLCATIGEANMTRTPGVIALNPDEVRMLASVWNVFPGSRVVRLGYPRGAA